MRRFLLIVFLLGLFSFPSSVFSWEDSSPNVPPDSYLYRDLDKLVALGLVYPPVLGQRPYPRSEFARITAEAIKNFEKQNNEEKEKLSFEEFSKKVSKKRYIGTIIEKLKEEFKEELVDAGVLEGQREVYRVHPIEDFTLYGIYLNSPPSTIPPNNGRGPISAQINPLEDYNLGRHIIDGGQFSTELTGRFQAGKFFSGYVRPRFEVNMPRHGDMIGKALVQNAYATFRAGNFTLEVGRDSMLWGIGERGDLLFSTNPRPLDGFRIGNPTPAKLPWIFKYLGNWRYTMFAANLGPEYSKKWAWLAGYKVSLEPCRYVETSFGHVVMIGGEGRPAPSALDVVGEFLGFRPAGTDPNSPNLTNHIMEIELLVRIMQLKGMQLYADFAIDDKWKSIKKTLTQGGGYLAGLYLPAINSSGSSDLRVEYVKTGPLLYRHGLYDDGYTLDRKLIGSDAGPDADTLNVTYRQTLSPNLWLGLTFGWDYRRSDTYTELANPDGTAGPIVQTGSGPTEKRYRGLFDVDWNAKENLNFHLVLGYERALNLFFTKGVDRNNYMAALALKINLDKHFAFAAH